jgi:hypothetical protein
MLTTDVFDNVSVTDSTGSGAPAITSPLTVTGTAGRAFSYSIAASNTPTRYNASGLPSGLTVSTGNGLISGTASATGTIPVTISAANASGTGSATLTMILLPSATNFAAWESTCFTQAQLNTPSVSGYLANPSGDGICNLLDYAFDLNPTVHNGPSSLPHATVNGGYLALTYLVNKSAGDLAYSVEVSGDLQTWNSGSGYTSSPVVLSDNGVTQTVQVTDLTSTSPANKRFIRLRVTAQ